MERKPQAEELMKNIRFLLLLFCPLVLLTSCFDILDKIHLKADGSGEYTIILNASKSKTRIASIAKMGTVNGKKVPTRNEIEAKLNEAAKIFKTVPGISQVKTSADFDNYILKLSCSFSKIENINDGLERLKAKNLIGKTVPTQLYRYDSVKKTLTRQKISTFADDYRKMSSADREVFTDAKYTSVLQFDLPVKSQSNSQYQLSPNKKAAKLDGAVTDFILQKKPLQNSIILQ